MKEFVVGSLGSIDFSLCPFEILELEIADRHRLKSMLPIGRATNSDRVAQLIADSLTATQARQHRSNPSFPRVADQSPGESVNPQEQTEKKQL